MMSPIHHSHIGLGFVILKWKKTSWTNSLKIISNKNDAQFSLLIKNQETQHNPWYTIVRVWLIIFYINKTCIHPFYDLSIVLFGSRWYSSKTLLTISIPKFKLDSNAYGRSLRPLLLTTCLHFLYQILFNELR